MIWFHRLKSDFHSLRSLWRRRQTRIATIRVLRRLDDRLLDDIGVVRGRIGEAARKAVDDRAAAGTEQAPASGRRPGPRRTVSGERPSIILPSPLPALAIA
ncbi:DUF1127 domain-containing protein [Oceanibacterium hippocampi]|uniref:YjiS-like domain-containing protein n=1 Tax=Oceanibacterium hippocampi TaxID=745714 RepID=A0A1Y5T097_9PROT|nr:DUF1127 domain-containing protein [Oceanibacterium hippocampi]SLN49119.1 hypothetical protein OCH7691_02145 [Oceanibacterium hippocampi]